MRMLGDWEAGRGSVSCCRIEEASAGHSRVHGASAKRRTHVAVVDPESGRLCMVLSQHPRPHSTSVERSLPSDCEL